MCPLFFAVALELVDNLLFVFDVGVPRTSLFPELTTPLLVGPATTPALETRLPSFLCEGESVTAQGIFKVIATNVGHIRSLIFLPYPFHLSVCS